MEKIDFRLGDEGKVPVQKMFLSSAQRSKSAQRSRSVSRHTVTHSVSTTHYTNKNDRRLGNLPSITKERSTFCRDSRNAPEKWGKLEEGEQITQPLLSFESRCYEEGSILTLWDMGTNTQKNVRVIDFGTYAEAKKYLRPYNAEGGIYTARGFSPFIMAVNLEVL